MTCLIDMKVVDTSDGVSRPNFATLVLKISGLVLVLVSKATGLETLNIVKWFNKISIIQ